METITYFLARLLKPILQPVSRWLASDARIFRTWWYEACFVGFLLFAVAAGTTNWGLLSHVSWDTAKPTLVNWLAVGAVLGSFLQAQVGFRLSEAQSVQISPTVECHALAAKFWLVKELAWAAVFLLTGAYSALVGNAVFIVYPAWRRIHLETSKLVRSASKAK